jgi:hypothetical protein
VQKNSPSICKELELASNGPPRFARTHVQRGVDRQAA